MSNVPDSTTVRPEFEQALKDSIELRWKPMAEGTLRLRDVPSCHLCQVSIDSKCADCPLAMLGLVCGHDDSPWDAFCAANTNSEHKDAASKMVVVLEECLTQFFPQTK